LRFFVADDDVARLNMTMTDALVSVMAGHLGAAERHVNTALPLADRLPSEVPNGGDLIRLTRWVGLLFNGELERSRSLALAELEAVGPHAQSSGTWHYAISMVDLQSGRPAAAVHRAEAAIRLLQWRDFTGLVDTAQAVHATALARVGRTADARDVITRLGPADDLDIWAALQCAEAEAWLAAAERRPANLVELLRVARRGVSAGQLCLAALTTHAAVRLGSPELAVDDLQDIAMRTEGSLMPALAAHASAAAARRPIDVLEAAERLAALGFLGAAADAAQLAARLFRSSGRGDTADEVLRRAAIWAGPGGTAPHELTGRELEIARFAAQRWSSREIAERLGMSSRTVDNHLSRVYRKLDIGGRPELAGALQRVGALS
jgi:DNA-binding CsgD family transcriptional regulator